jgi:Macrophage migration inhibitory factor (MIF)
MEEKYFSHESSAILNDIQELIKSFSDSFLIVEMLSAGVSITDKASVIFGGSDAPCALGNMYSIGAIGMESNGKIQVRPWQKYRCFLTHT